MVVVGTFVRASAVANIFYLFEYFYIALSSCEFLALYIHTHTTGYATWVTLESRLHDSGADQSFPVSFSRALFSSHFVMKNCTMKRKII
jgi:hypothetical protein